ncbi:hypothetical protein O181_103563 [Austropuccinia psidii MF-1]|uniref:Uncharacterized protein n=1 Tax=Austropuccinia psidii MF-1 TaxID=1389203 RepID=A0A9Q3JKK6_9BASI|nr:hypothetical protein [Austropuccinia psidii MF-1]
MLASTSTNLHPPVASTSRDPISPDPEPDFDHHCRWNITANFTDQNKMNKKVDSFTEFSVHKAMNSAVPGESTRALVREAVSY